MSIYVIYTVMTMLGHMSECPRCGTRYAIGLLEKRRHFKITGSSAARVSLVSRSRSGEEGKVINTAPYDRGHGKATLLVLKSYFLVRQLLVHQHHQPVDTN